MRTDVPIPAENPPAYESAITGSSTGIYPPHALLYGRVRIRRIRSPRPQPLMLAGTLPLVYGANASDPTVYYYQDPRTGQRVASLLPPDHPQMTRYGFLGVLAAIVWFPLGIGLCLLDRRVRCERCGESLEDGLCS
ncbi:hypothetical protein F5148DRAFT_1277035 [Russula earlei]|uniref:Uncharacterized protein n=1 Tax=Russula earlei TaxID=71964 RepID=A0ACC0U2V0_9AGAM|nr:hypothetical protein F5148DRAFT_1277035 [Russula earlei]